MSPASCQSGLSWWFLMLSTYALCTIDLLTWIGINIALATTFSSVLSKQITPVSYEFLMSALYFVWNMTCISKQITIIMKIYPILRTDTTNSSCFSLFIANTVCVLPVNDYDSHQAVPLYDQETKYFTHWQDGHHICQSHHTELLINT